MAMGPCGCLPALGLALRAPRDLQEDVTAAGCHPPLLGPAPNSPAVTESMRKGTVSSVYGGGNSAEEDCPQGAAREPRGAVGGEARLSGPSVLGAVLLPDQPPRQPPDGRGGPHWKESGHVHTPNVSSLFKKRVTNPVLQVRKPFPPGQYDG